MVDEICVIPRAFSRPRGAARRAEKVLHTLVVQKVKYIKQFVCGPEMAGSSPREREVGPFDVVRAWVGVTSLPSSASPVLPSPPRSAVQASSSLALSCATGTGPFSPLPPLPAIHFLHRPFYQLPRAYLYEN